MLLLISVMVSNENLFFSFVITASHILTTMFSTKKSQPKSFATKSNFQNPTNSNTKNDQL